jgi:hypothetical protein
MIMLSRYFPPARRSVPMLATMLALATLSACGPNGLALGDQSKIAGSDVSAQPAQLIAQLQQAKAVDENNAQDPTISFPRRGDYLDHARQAEIAIGDLQHGFAVPQDSIAYALEIPPKHLTPEQRAALIRQLEDAIRKDNSREQALVSFGTNVFYTDPTAPAQFNLQEQLAEEQIKDLEEGYHVSWDNLEKALHVPD